MYEQHFGLRKRPFRANATGTDVFVGPQIASTMAGLKKALAKEDAIVTVTGPVGSGKTTVVSRALESISDNAHVIHVARMRLDSDDVLEFLLDELDVQDRPSGTIQKFSLFRRRLKELQDSNSRVFIAVEDANHLDVDTLAELEALTAADAGDSEGASVVLMGDEKLDALLKESGLTRLQQRIRQRHSIVPLCAAELRGYLRHCFRLAGGDFEQVFEANAAPLLHHLSDGVPRISNNLIESAMSAAADQDLARVSSELLARVAENEYGLSAAGFDLTQQPATTPAPIATPVAEAAPEPEPKPKPEPEPEPEIVAEAASLPGPEPEPEPEPVLEASPWPEPARETDAEPENIPELLVEEPVIVFAEPVIEQAIEPIVEPVVEPIAERLDEQQDEDIEEDDIPELIQDTLPDLEILAPQLAAAAEHLMSDPLLEPEAEVEDVVEPEPEPEPEPELQVEPHPEVSIESAGNEVPEWDRDPTMAELKPDLAALEQAMAFAHSDEPEPVVEDSASIPEPETPEVIPEITLDNAISKRIESNLIDEKDEVSAPDSENLSASTDNAGTPAVTLPPKNNKKADAEIEKIAQELAKAKSIEDVDDKLAETLFGEELNLAAAQIQMMVKANASNESANDENNGVATGERVPNGSPAPEVETTPEEEVTLSAPHQLDDSGMDLSASQRLKTVRALNADLQPSIREPEATASDHSPQAPGSAPDSIEDQINTSMTQTLKALNVRPPVNDDEIDDGEQKGGFFSRFKRS